MNAIVETIEGDSPVILSIPHAGRDLIPGLEPRLTDAGKALVDTDWHVDRLYDGLLPNASVVRAKLSRTVVDLNRDPSGAALYEGQTTTGLCPVESFDGAALYIEGQEPSDSEIQERIEKYFRPYHDALALRLAQTVDRHGIAVLYDCHSIKSEAPRLFDGRLPVFNIGTNKGESCHEMLTYEVAKACRAVRGMTTIVNGRFTGGYITRHYGWPEERVHAIQMELAQRVYMTEGPPWTYQEKLAGRTREALGGVLAAVNAWAIAQTPAAKSAGAGAGQEKTP